MLSYLSANRISKTQRAHGIFSVSRTKRKLRNGKKIISPHLFRMDLYFHRPFGTGIYADRISDRAAVHLAAALDYLILEIVEMAAQICQHHDRSRITPRHIALAVQSDYDMAELLKQVTVAQGGVRPLIHPHLMQRYQNDDDTESSSSAD